MLRRGVPFPAIYPLWGCPDLRFVSSASTLPRCSLTALSHTGP